MTDSGALYAQFNRLRQENPDCILMIMLGSFYEFLCRDAYIASKILDLKISRQNFNKKMQVPKCGVPLNSLEKYATLLAEKGYKVAICDQIEGKKENKIIRREAVRFFLASPNKVAPISLDDRDEYAVFFAKFEEKNKLENLYKKETILSENPLKYVELITELKAFDLNSLTGYDALKILQIWKNKYD